MPIDNYKLLTPLHTGKIKLEKELEAKSKELATLALEHKQLNMKTKQIE